MPFTTLVDTATLAREIGNPDWAIVDCRFRLDDPSWGAARYAESHIPGAVFADLDRDLSGEKTGENGRHPLPSPDALRRVFGRLGIDDHVQVVAYDQDSGMFAARLWWLLRWLGHPAVAVLDGGLAAWLASGGAAIAGQESRPARTFSGHPRTGAIVSAGEVAALATGGGHRLIDARAPERYSGAVEPIDRRAGHIPSAVNYWYQSSVDATGRFQPRGILRQQLETALAGLPADRAVCYCGSGVTACHVVLAMEHAGLAGAKLYPGSWSEWSSDPRRPIESDS
jgi:thiosulfate/3-mercaptopyruvate sulfurtransferase